MVEALVPGRDCGGCTVCCVVPGIDKPEIQKRSGAPCRHSGASGCAIYETRPPICREFFCAWRRYDFFGEDWRPDRSGIFAEPVIWEGRSGFCLTLIGDPLAIARRPDFVDFIVTGIRGGAPVVVQLPGPRGHQGARILLNTEAMRRAAAQSRDAVAVLLEHGVRGLMVHAFQPMTLIHSGNDVSS